MFLIDFIHALGVAARAKGMTAALVGIDRVAFLRELARFQVAVIDLEPDELQQDFANA